LSYSVPVHLEGTITQGKAYGERNDGTVGQSKLLQLSLPASICTISTNAELDDGETNVTAMQIYSVNGAAAHLHAGQHVSVTGTLLNVMTTN